MTGPKRPWRLLPTMTASESGEVRVISMRKTLLPQPRFRSSPYRNTAGAGAPDTVPGGARKGSPGGASPIRGGAPRAPENRR
ncbi:hypothetical protein GCM10010273_06590 [Streptomyces lavendulocolor]